MKKLNKKECLFCSYYSITRNPREAAAKAGYTFMPERNSIKLLGRPEILNEIKRIDKRRSSNINDIATGYRRLAFGSIADAVRLLISEDKFDVTKLEELDLFCISEIKCPRNGGMEIKFFDRLKALEKLQALSEMAAEDKALPFYEAIERGVKAISSMEGKIEDE